MSVARSSRKSLSWRVLSVVVLGIVVLITLYGFSAYYNRVQTSEDLVLQRLESVARTAAQIIDGDAHQQLMNEYIVKNAIEQTGDDSTYKRLHQQLETIEDINQLGTPIYTLVPEADHYEFGVTSAENPYFRHKWINHPEQVVGDYQTGGVIQRYTDENGTWLSGFAPIKTKKGKVVAVIMADAKFGEFIAEVRSQVLMEILVGILLGGVVLFVLYRILKPIADQEEEARRKITKAYKVIKRKQRELSESLSVIQSKNEKINHSLNYAGRLQQALLPGEKQLRQELPESFMFFRGKDIVSGDFPYLLHHPSGATYLAAVDCTGHGVPGALLSFMGYFMLNDIINARGLTDPGTILTELHRNVVRALNQEEADQTSQDGMDVALIKIEPDRRKVAFAGAHRPLYHLQKGEMQEIKGERLSIGGTQYSSSGRKVEFQTTEIASEPGDLFFLGSDGYQDQIGGEEKKKFRSKQLRDLLAGVNGHSMETVGQQVEETFDHWKGDEPQMDDVLLMGVRI